MRAASCPSFRVRWRAIQAFQSDGVLRQALDERFSDYYVTSRAWEVKAFQGTVTDWERDRYMRTV